MYELGHGLERKHERILAAIEQRPGLTRKPRRAGLLDILPSGQVALASEVIEQEGRGAVLFVQQALGIAFEALWAMPASEFWHLYVRAYQTEEAKAKEAERRAREAGQRRGR